MKTKKSPSRQPSGRFVLYFNGVTILVILSLFFLVYFYVTADRRAVFMLDVRHRLQLAALELRGQFAVNRERLLALASRSMIRRKLNSYMQGGVSLATLRSYTRRKYREGCRVYPDLLRIRRLTPDGTLVAQYSADGNEVFPAPLLRESVSVTNGVWRHHAVTPIKHGARIIGMDAAVFRLIRPAMFSRPEYSKVCLHPVQPEERPEALIQSIPGTLFFLSLYLDPDYLPEELKKANTSLFFLGLAAFFVFYLLFRWTVILRAGSLIADYRELSEERAEHADLLREQHEVKDRIFSLVSHDLKGPFASLNEVGTMLKERVGDMQKKEIQEMAGVIADTGARAYDLMTNMLAWATGGVEWGIAAERFSLSLILSEVKSSLDSIAQEKGCVIEIDCAGEPFAIASQQTIRIALHNLLTNAIKFSPRGGRVLLSAYPEEGGESVAVAVSDSGIGMDEATVAAIFQFNRKISRRGTEGEQGSGIGLSLIHDLLQREGIVLAVRSAPGEGSCFTLHLPTTPKERA